MTDFSKLPQCPSHGRFTGRLCPICDWNPLAPSVVAPAVVVAVEEYDRTTWHRGPEAELHGWLEAELIRLGISYIHARTDQKSTIANGWPDFSAFFTAPDGITRACFVELKNRAGRTSADQCECIASLRTLNIPVLVTGDFREAVAFIKLHLAYP